MFFTLCSAVSVLVVFPLWCLSLCLAWCLLSVMLHGVIVLFFSAVQMNRGSLHVPCAVCAKGFVVSLYWPLSK